MENVLAGDPWLLSYTAVSEENKPYCGAALYGPAIGMLDRVRPTYNQYDRSQSVTKKCEYANC